MYLDSHHELYNYWYDLGQKDYEKKVIKAIKQAKKKCPTKGLNLMVLDWYEQYIKEILRIK